MPLHSITSEKVLRSIAPDDPRRRITDGGGLYLLRDRARGIVAWRFDYAHGGLRKTLSLGPWPAVTLAQARAKAAEMRAAVKEGRDPSEARREARAAVVATASAGRRRSARLPDAGTFEAVARDWLARVHAVTVVPAHYARNVRRLEVHAFPYIGRRPVSELGAPELLSLLRRVEETGAVETAHRVRSLLSQVFRFAVASGLAERDPAADLRDALPPARVRHHAAPTSPDTVAELVRMVWAYRGLTLSGPALRLALLTGQRPGEVRGALWEEVDLTGRVWRIPAARMKGGAARKAGQPHLVPLEGEALALLGELHAVRGSSPYVFPGLRGGGRPLSSAAFAVALAAMGIDRRSTFTTHGARAILRTLAAERLGFAPEVIEAHLDHAPAGPLGRAYDRAQHLAERRRLMAVWSAYLAKLREGIDPDTAARDARRTRPAPAAPGAVGAGAGRRTRADVEA